jgi:hypothetical protein
MALSVSPGWVTWTVPPPPVPGWVTGDEKESLLWRARGVAECCVCETCVCLTERVIEAVEPAPGRPRSCSILLRLASLTMLLVLCSRSLSRRTEGCFEVVWEDGCFVDEEGRLTLGLARDEGRRLIDVVIAVSSLLLVRCLL